MNYSLALSEQLNTFLYAVGFGFLLGVLYRIIMLFRDEAGKSKRLVFAADLLFCIITTMLSFCFMLVYTNGQVRLNVIIAFAAGFTFYMLTADRTVRLILSPIALLSVRAVKLMLFPFTLLLRKMKSFAKRIKKFFASRKKTQKTKEKPEKELKSKKRFTGLKSSRISKVFLKSHLKNPTESV